MLSFSSSSHFRVMSSKLNSSGCGFSLMVFPQVGPRALVRMLRLESGEADMEAFF